MEIRSDNFLLSLNLDFLSIIEKTAQAVDCVCSKMWLTMHHILNDAQFSFASFFMILVIFSCKTSINELKTHNKPIIFHVMFNYH